MLICTSFWALSSFLHSSVGIYTGVGAAFMVVTCWTEKRTEHLASFPQSIAYKSDCVRGCFAEWKARIDMATTIATLI